MTFVRFVLPEQHNESGSNDGLFRTAYALRGDPGTSETDAAQLADLLKWFEVNLPEPTRFNRTTSKGHYRRAARGISWFRDSAADCVSRMFELKQLLEEHGHQVTLIRESRPGYIVYEDALQIVAEPFSDTATQA
jgi:hypothetical protein